MVLIVSLKNVMSFNLYKTKTWKEKILLTQHPHPNALMWNLSIYFFKRRQKTDTRLDATKVAKCKRRYPATCLSGAPPYGLIISNLSLILDKPLRLVWPGQSQMEKTRSRPDAFCQSKWNMRSQIRLVPRVERFHFIFYFIMCWHLLFCPKGMSNTCGIHAQWQIIKK